MKLLILADDFTGALDTGVQLAARGARTVFAPWGAPMPKFNSADVITLDLATRHLPPAEAYLRVKDAAQHGSTDELCIYKKTDSCLRGNIGAELEAALHASGAPRLHFIPAWPSEGRITRYGTHYVSGVPVSESPFGRDALNPIPTSTVAELVALQSDLPVHVLNSPETSKEGICVYNCETEEQMSALAHALFQSGELRAAAGCAGFAYYLGKYISSECVSQEPLPRAQKLLILSGSINPVTLNQLEQAKTAGVPCAAFSATQRRQAPSVDAALIAEVNDMLNNNYAAILCAGADAPDCSPEAMAQAMGAAAGALYADGMALAVFGGDTLSSVADALGISSIMPAGEIEAGVPASRAEGQCGLFTLISKSGGLAKPDAILNIIKYCHKISS